jgi:hypothetical protein
MPIQVIILAGGKSERFGGTVPKPFVRLWGKQMGEFLGESLRNSFEKIYWICGPLIKKYDIEGESTRWWKKGNHYFHHLKYQTRSPVESLYNGLQAFLQENILDPNEPILVLDNDNYYDETLQKINNDFFSDCSGAILTRKVCEYDSERYGFLHVQKQFVEDVKEKKRKWGETHVSLGGYAYQSVYLLLKKLFLTEKHSLLECFFETPGKLRIIETTTCYSLGTPEDMELASFANPEKFGWKARRIVVDLDNTLVTYPRKYGDYSTVEFRPEILRWLQYVQSKGAILILSTARRSETHKGNVGKIIADIGQTVFQSIQDSGLKFEEIHFGKAYGDIYLDDRGYNPNEDKWKTHLGDFHDEVGHYQDTFEPILHCSNENIQKTKIDIIIKKGTLQELNGYIYFLKKITSYPLLQTYFPLLFQTQEKSDMCIINIEYIKGIEASVLYANNFLKVHDWNTILATLKYFHSHRVSDIVYTKEDLHHQWIKKTNERLEKFPEHYSYLSLLPIIQTVHERLAEYIDLRYKDTFEPCIIHGDSWLSNILLNEKNIVSFIDMRGKTSTGKFTITGDYIYDYAKLGTSIFGMDSAVYKLPFNSNWEPYWHLLQDACPEEYRIYLPFCILSLMITALWKYDAQTRSNIVERIKILYMYILS